MSFMIYTVFSKDIKIIGVVSDYGIGNGNMVIKEFVTFHCIIKNIVLDIYILCNEAVIHTYIFRYVSNVFRINL